MEKEKGHSEAGRGGTQCSVEYCGSRLFACESVMTHCILGATWNNRKSRHVLFVHEEIKMHVILRVPLG